MHIRRNIILFFLLTYAFTWVGNIGIIMGSSDWWAFPMNPLGPLMAAPIVIGLTLGWRGVKDWARRITRFRAPLWVYAASIGIPTAIILASVGLSIATGSAHALDASDIAAWSTNAGGLMFLAFALFEIINGPYPEEVSFRGHGQHDLQQTMSPLQASLWIGIGVLIWHLPLLILNFIPWPLAVALPAVSVVYGWLYQNGKSLYPLVILHLVQNVVGAGFFGRMFSEGENFVWLSFLTGFYILLAIGLAWKFGPSLVKGRDREWVRETDVRLA